MILEIMSKRYSHPNIIPIYGLYNWEIDLGYGTDYVFAFVMQKALCSFEEVAQNVANKKINLTDIQIVKIMFQIVDGMNYLYGVVKIGHCDLKPANILKMDMDYSLVISDFGISKKLRENTLKFGYTKNILGTKDFLSPELFIKIFCSQDEDQQINIEKSDVFSAGLTILNICGYNIKGFN